MKMILSLLVGFVLIMGGAALLTHQWITMSPAEMQSLYSSPLGVDNRHPTSGFKLTPILGVVMLVGGAALVFGTERHAANRGMRRSDAGYPANQQPGGNLNPSKRPTIIRKSA